MLPMHVYDSYIFQYMKNNDMRNLFMVNSYFQKRTSHILVNVRKAGMRMSFWFSRPCTASIERDVVLRASDILNAAEPDAHDAYYDVFLDACRYCRVSLVKQLLDSDNAGLMTPTNHGISNLCWGMQRASTMKNYPVAKLIINTFLPQAITLFHEYFENGDPDGNIVILYSPGHILRHFVSSLLFDNMFVAAHWLYTNPVIWAEIVKMPIQPIIDDYHELLDQICHRRDDQYEHGLHIMATESSASASVLGRVLHLLHQHKTEV
jgi:hypothetical protein